MGRRHWRIRFGVQCIRRSRGKFVHSGRFRDVSKRLSYQRCGNDNLDVDPVVTIKSKTNLFGMVPYLPKIWKTAYDQTAIDRKKNSWRTEPRLIWNLGGEAGTRHGGTRRHKLSGRDFSQLRLRSRDQKLLEHDLFHRVRNIHPPPTNGFAVALRPMPTSQISAELVKHRSAIPLSPSGVTDRNSADGSVVRMSTASDVHLPGAVEA